MGAQDQQGSLKTNQKVVVWAAGRIGRKVGRGECWDLAEAALEQAGARTSNDLGPVGEDADYVWGDEIDIKDVRAGDILQFRDFEVTTTTDTEYGFADGSFETRTETATSKRGHHTAIATAKLDPSGMLATLEQNAEPRGKVVQWQTLNTRDTCRLPAR